MDWGYCLLFESTLPSVLHARDVLVVNPDGAILPDTAEMYPAGFGKLKEERICLSGKMFIDSTLKCVGEEVVRDATQAPIVDVVDSKDVVTTVPLPSSRYFQLFAVQ